ncbi:MAG: ABC transporter permease [Bacteroidota bacterium]
MKKRNPPKWALRFLQFYCKDRYLEQIEGDLFELFERNPSTIGFIWNIIRFFRLRYMKGLDGFEQLATLAMIKNYLKVALRSLLKQKIYAGINIVGLAIALASCMLITTYILHEKSYDNFFKEGDQIYRITKNEFGSYTPPLLAHVIREEIPQFDAATRSSGVFEAFFEVGSKQVKQDGAIRADQYFFDVFNINFLKGNKEQALKKPNSVVLSQQIALKYFGDNSPIDEIIKIDGDNFIVTGVFENLPRNTHYPFTYIVADHLDLSGTYYWTGGSGITYAKLSDNSSYADAYKSLEKIYEKYAGPEIITWTGYESFEKMKEDYPNTKHVYFPHSIRSIHLDQPHLSHNEPGNKEANNIFSIVALGILLIACINYINMSTARSTLRSKEVGIRKTLGSFRKQMLFQLLIESALITFFAILIAFIISFLSLKFFSEITLRAFNLQDMISLENLAFTFLLFLLTSLMAGAYPAFVISRFNPVEALRGTLKLKRKSYFRNGLVVFQIAASVFLITISLVIYSQVDHLLNQDMKIDLHKTMVLRNGYQLGDKYDIFKQELERLKEIEIISKSDRVPFMGINNYGYTAPDKGGKAYNLDNIFAGSDFEQVFNLELVKGRFLNPNSLLDTSKVLLNETAVKEIGWHNAIGKKLMRDPFVYEVVGVVKDFNYQSLKQKINPMIIRYGASVYDIGIWHQNNILIKYHAEDSTDFLDDLQKKWSTFVPGYPIDISFLEETFNKTYDGERRFGQIFTSFSILALIIATLGLFSLIAFVLQRRRKEITIRKVFGAPAISIITLLSKEFSILAILGGTIGISISYYWLKEWLNDYSYRIDLKWSYLALPLLFILVLTWILVSGKSYRAAISNPSSALKEE